MQCGAACDAEDLFHFIKLLISGRAEIKFPEPSCMSYSSRAALCVEVYKHYKGIYLGYVLRKPNYIALAVCSRKVSFPRFKARPKTVHVMSCGLSQMFFTHYYDPVGDFFIFKGSFKNTVYVLRENADMDPESLYLDAELSGVDVKSYIDLSNN